MSTLAIIPARAGSKRFVGKNLASLHGKPLLVHSIEYAQKNSGIIDEVVVSTNDAEIKGVALSQGAVVVDRPEYLSGDHEPTVTALQHVLASLPQKFDTVVLLQATNPLRPSDLLEDAFQTYEKGNYDSLMTVSRNHQKFGKIKEGKFVPFNYTMGQRSQDLEPLYFENGLLYLSKSSLIEQGKILGENNCPFVVDHPYAHIDIDLPEDLELAQYYLNK